MIMKLISEKNEVLIKELDGRMRANGITTTWYHLRNHLELAGFVEIYQKGTIKKKKYVKMTEKGKNALENTINKERKG